MLKKSLLFLSVLPLFVISCQHTDQKEAYGCPYSSEYRGCTKCNKKAGKKCKNAKKGELCKKCVSKSCDKCKKKSACKRKKKDAVSLIFPVNNSQVKGWVHFKTTKDKKVLVKAEISGLKPNQKHGFHIHQYGDCRNNGQSVGVHFNPYQVKHGAPDHKEKHLGDLGNLKSNTKGIAFYQNTLKMRVKKLIGRSVVIHANPDDLKSQPSGNSGAYIGCGVIGRIPAEEKTEDAPVKTVSDKKEEAKKEEGKKTDKEANQKKETKKQENNQEEKETKDQKNNKATSSEKATPPVTVVKGKIENQKTEKAENKQQ